MTTIIRESFRPYSHDGSQRMVREWLQCCNKSNQLFDLCAGGSKHWVETVHGRTYRLSLSILFMEEVRLLNRSNVVTIDAFRVI